MSPSIHFLVLKLPKYVIFPTFVLSAWDMKNYGGVPVVVMVSALCGVGVIATAHELFAVF